MKSSQKITKMINLKNATQYSFKNKDKIVKECSCYNCFGHFNKEQITQWTDQGQTAICPLCSVDSVLPEHLDENLLKEINKYWFGS